MINDQNVINVYKDVSKTPFECVSRVKEQFDMSDVKVGYAGRLDPMARGVLLLLIGSENKNKLSYERLEKDYEFECLFGMSTDSYDILGLPIKVFDESITWEQLNPQIPELIKQVQAIREQEYPPFSAGRYKGKPLFYYSKNHIKIKNPPKNKVSIKNLEFVSYRLVAPQVLFKEIESRVKNIQGDFRQEKTITKWYEFFEEQKQPILITKFKITCSSGTYVRGLVNQMGKIAGYGATVFEITRTRIDIFKIEDSIKLEWLS